MDIRKYGIKFRRYESQLGFTKEFEMVRKLLVEVNSNKMTKTNFLWARWEWAISLMYMMNGSLEYNGLWFDGDEPDNQEFSERYQGPNFDKTHHIYVKAPNGDYASYCGTWYDKDTDYAYIEPACTDPLYRKIGCAKAAVYEAIKRCGKLGAKRAYVISSQQFYYNIGFYPVETYTWWNAANK
jgi:GNAT superfamily N-acetyltransferase